MLNAIRGRIDGFTVLLVFMVVLASVLPARGRAADAIGVLAQLGIALLFFLHGAKLSRHAILAGAGHWRLHLAVLAATFVAFPLLGLALQPLLARLTSPMLAAGILYLCLLPSTVQSSIAFTSIAGGNVAAAVCAAALSTLIGTLLTPLLVHLTMAAGSGAGSWDSVRGIALQLLLPFGAGHALRPLIGGWIERNRGWIGKLDRGSILLVVYAAFSAAVAQGLWRHVSGADLAVLFAVSAGLLAVALALTMLGGRVLGLAREDRIVLVFCGSKKSLATGVPMAGLIFPAAAVGPLLLPVMIFHQLQLIVCAVLARRYAAGAAPG